MPAAFRLFSDTPWEGLSVFMDDCFSPLTPSVETLATLAFLVVFSALIRDFFWIDILRAPRNLKFYFNPRTLSYVAGRVPNSKSPICSSSRNEINDLRNQPPKLATRAG